MCDVISCSVWSCDGVKSVYMNYSWFITKTGKYGSYGNSHINLHLNMIYEGNSQLAKASWCQRERWNGGAENDGHENGGPSDRAWNCKTWNCRAWNYKTQKISQLLIIVNIALFSYLYSLYCRKLFEIVYSCYKFKSLVLLLAQITPLADLSFDPFLIHFISTLHCSIDATSAYCSSGIAVFWNILTYCVLVRLSSW